jgi:hypothetical protein
MSAASGKKAKNSNFKEMYLVIAQHPIANTITTDDKRNAFASL